MYPDCEIVWVQRVLGCAAFAVGTLNKVVIEKLEREEDVIFMDLIFLSPCIRTRSYAIISFSWSCV